MYSEFPSDFFVNQAEYSLTYQSQVEIEDEFHALDLTVYNNTANDTMEYQYTSISDCGSATPPQWETTITNRFCEVWWGLYNIPSVGNFPAIRILDTEKREFLGVPYYVALTSCQLTVNGEDIVGTFLLDSTIINDYGDEYSITVSAHGGAIQANMILRGNNSQTLEDSIADGVLLYSFTWEIDFDAMKPSIWVLLGQLISFQNPDFGIPGLFGSIITYTLGLVSWAIIILIAYTLISKLIPTIQGGLED